METTQIDKQPSAEDPQHLLTAETLTAIRHTFAIDHTFPQKWEHTPEVKDDAPKGWFARFRHWLLRSGSARRAHLAESVRRKEELSDRQ